MKQRYTKILVAVFAIVFISAFVFATRPDTMPDQARNSFALPKNAVEISPGVFSLGQARDVDGRVVEGYLFVRDRRENAKPPWAGGGKDKGGESTCYQLFAKEARWKTTEGYITSNETDKEVNLALTEISLEEWDTEVSFDIFGAGTSGTTDGADTASPDGKNEVMFENLGATDTIAYTIVWGIWSGRPSGREIVEWDAVFNSDYSWSLTGEAGKMDYQNIATHEFGHAAGLGHPSDSCTEETMYRFASEGETNKRDLHAGDIAGIQKLYTL